MEMLKHYAFQKGKPVEEKSGNSWENCEENQLDDPPWTKKCDVFAFKCFGGAE